MKLWIRVALLCAALIAVASVCVGVYSAARQAEALRLALDERGTTLARSLATRGREALAAGDRARLAALLDVWEEDDVLEAAFLDADGAVLAARAFGTLPGTREPFVCSYPVNLPAAPSGTTPPGSGDPDFERTIGLTRVTLSTARLEAESARITRTTAWIVGLVGAVGVLLAFALARFVTGPLERLAAATGRVASGDLGARVDASGAGGPELATLGGSFNEMVRAVQTRDEALRAQRDQLERSYAALLRLEETKEALTRMIVHDLKNPLGSMLVGLDLLDRTRLSEADREVHGTVQARGRALMGMIGDLLDARRLEEGKMPVHAETLDLAHLASAVAREMALEAREIGATIRVEGGEARAVADSALLRRVLGNLIGNALRHHPSGGGEADPVRVEIRSASGGEVRVAVRDRGPGIPEAERDHVFDMFVTGPTPEGGAAGPRHGTGVGLAFCKLAMTAMGGGIRAAPPAEGEGAVLELWLPASAEETPA